MATATRVNGVFPVFGLAVLYLCLVSRRTVRFRMRDVLALGTSAVGGVGYWVWLTLTSGSAGTFLHSQGAGWHRQLRWPWQTLVNQGVHMLREPLLDWRLQAWLESGVAVAVCVLVVVMLRRREWASATYVGTTTLSMLTSNSYLSLARGSLSMFPVDLTLASVLGRCRPLWFRLVLGCGAALLIVNTVQLALGHWAD